MSKCVDIRPVVGCFIPNDTSVDSISILIHTIYGNDEQPVGNAYTLPDDPETPLDITTYLGGGQVFAGQCETEQCLTECEVGGSGGYDITDTLFRCSKIGFTLDNAFTSLCPDGWTPQDLVDRLNEGNPNGAVFAVQSGNIIEVVSGTPPELIQFFHSGGGETTIYPGEGVETLCAQRVKDCNSDRNIELLQEIADNTCANTVSSNVVCASTAQTVALESGGTTNLIAGQELLVGEVYDCRANLQSFNISVLIAGQLEPIADPVDTGTCPTPQETIPTGCIKDLNGQEWDSFQTTLNGTTITYYQDSITGQTGTPAGDPSDWSECGSETVISIPTISVFDADNYLSGGLNGHDTNSPSYDTDIEALPVAFPADYVPPVYIQNKTRTDYYRGNGVFAGDTNEFAEIGAKVWFPESAVLPVEIQGDNTTEIELPTISIIDFDQNSVSNQDENVSDLLAGGYTTDIEALPIGVPAGHYLPVKLGLNEQEYYQGNGNNSSTTALRVAFPESAVIRTESEISIPTITVEDYNAIGNNSQGTTSFDMSSYQVDVESLPIATLPEVFLNVQHRTYFQSYYQGDGNFGDTEVSMKVALPESYIQRSEISLPTITVQSNPTSYPADLEAMPVAFEEGYIPSVFIEAEDQEYYAGRDNNGNEVLNQAYSTRVSLNTSAVLRSEETKRPVNYFHRDSDVDGTITIPTGVNSWSIYIADNNGPDVITNINGQARNTPAQVGEIHGSEQRSSMDHTIVVNPNGNRVYVTWSIVS